MTQANKGANILAPFILQKYIGRMHMSKTVFDYEIRKLNDSFFEKYNKKEYPEIEVKKGRPYNFILFEIRYNCFVAAPFRTNIKHENSFKFEGCKRNKFGTSGIDYSKILIIEDSNYIGEASRIDYDEHSILVKNIVTIATEINDYIDDYKNHISGIKKMGKNKFRNKYKFSTLKYFHKELGI